MKKILIFVLMITALIYSGFSATEVITQCPSSPTSNTDYVLASNFVNNLNPCFNLAGLQNITITTNETYIATDLDISIATSNHIEIFGSKLDSLVISTLTSNTGDFYVYDNTFYDQGAMLSYTGQSLGVRSWYGFRIYNNYFHMATPTSYLLGVYNTCSAGLCPTQRFTFYDLDIMNNDFEGGASVLYGAGGNSNGYGEIYLQDTFSLGNNNIATNTNWANGRVIGSGFADCNAVTISNPYYGYLTLLDEDNDFQTDTSYSISIGGCVEENVPKLTQNVPINNEKVGDNIKYFFASMVSNVYSSTRYILTNEITLTSSNYIDMDSVQNSILDLSLFPNVNALTLSNVRTLQMGNNNKIYGGEGTKPIILSSGTISIPYSGYGSEYSNNWQLIDFYNNLEIDNINFDLNAVDDYGLVRKYNTGVDGINFYMHDCEIDVNFVPASPDRPLMMVGAFSKLINNVFYLPSTTNMSVLGGGLSSNVGGGHIIEDNVFWGGGFIFSRLTDAFGGTNYQSKFIHNSFAQTGTLYAQPFNPNDETYNLLLEPALNGTYYYKTLCTNYEFNVGNWYEDWADSGFYNDSNGDGIHDSFLGLDYIERGQDYLGNPIRDYRSVTPYPYDFAGQTGNADATYDTCQAFSYNVIQPTAQNYTSGSSITSNWEFVAIAYPIMFCFETLNGFTTIYPSVSTGDNKGVTYDTTDGSGTFSIRCCDTANCDNIVKDLEPVSFCIGDCNLGELVVLNISEPSTPVYGCTDSEATNYNPSATIDDGSCTYGTGGDGDTDSGTGGTIGNILDFDNPESSAEATTSLLGTFGNLLFIIGIPLLFAFVIGGIFIIFINLIG